MQKILITFKLFFIIPLLWASSTKAEPLVFYPAPITPPAFSWKDVEGKELTLENYKGKVVLLNFWATFCKYCLVEMPAFEKMLNLYSSDDFIIIPISLADTPDKIKKFYTQTNLTKLGIFYDDTGHIKNTFGVGILPSSFLINRNGELIAYKEGMPNWLGEELNKYIQKEIDNQ